jgi:hypothetical protein
LSINRQSPRVSSWHTSYHDQPLPTLKNGAAAGTTIPFSYRPIAPFYRSEFPIAA